jgi:hypothetical protein
MTEMNHDPQQAQRLEPFDGELPEEFRQLVREHHRLQELLAFALVSNPDIAPPEMLSWAEQVRAKTTFRNDCGATDE